MTFFTHDCFHFTIKGHEELAKGLWNNMVNTDLHCVTFNGITDKRSASHSEEFTVDRN